MLFQAHQTRFCRDSIGVDENSHGLAGGCHVVQLAFGDRACGVKTGVRWEAYRKDPEKESVGCCRQHEQPCEVYQLLSGGDARYSAMDQHSPAEAAAKTMRERASLTT